MGTIEKKSRKDYEYFKFLANNRPISKKHLGRLRKQFQLYGNITEISPITVNKHGFIIDGQHRRILCEEFGLPIYYVEVDVAKEVTPAMNSNQKPWTSMNFVEFFAAYKPEYELLRKFISANEVSYDIASAIIFPNRNPRSVQPLLQSGDLEVKDYLVEGQKRMDIVHELAEIFGAVPTRAYVTGVMKCLYMDNFNIERFINKARMVMKSTAPFANPRATNMMDVYRNIETVYNYHMSDANSVMLFR